MVAFSQNQQELEYGFHEVSEGQRCLIALYTVLHFVLARGGTVFLDEPENFIGLGELQPWLMAAGDAVDEHDGQIFIVSHHPEFLNQWAPDYGIWFSRPKAGPVQVRPFQAAPDEVLTVAELVARGWDEE
jgi:predicted ATPase